MVHMPRECNGQKSTNDIWEQWSNIWGIMGNGIVAGKLPGLIYVFVLKNKSLKLWINNPMPCNNIWLTTYHIYDSDPEWDYNGTEQFLSQSDFISILQ